MSVAAFLIGLVKLWLILGALVAAAFLTFGISQIDEDAEGALGFRPLIVPGILMIWPLVLWRWWVLASGRDNWRQRHRPPRRSHGVVAVVMAGLLLLTLGTSLSLRQTWPAHIAPQQLSGAEVSQ